LVPAGPGYDETSTSLKTCAAVGAVAGKATVDGDTYLRVTYGYIVDHQWRYVEHKHDLSEHVLTLCRNLGILCAMMLSMCTFHIIAAQYILAAKPKGEILAYLPSRLARHQQNDEERVSNRIQADRDPRRTALQGLEKQSRIVHWENIAYEVPQKRTSRQILHGIDGWAKPGTLTALMGATGAGKTTLLDVLARRTKTGATSGGIYIDGAPIGTDFPRKIGYSQQSDIHLSTATVREALIFSARLRQPKSTSDAEKLRYVDEVLHVLDLMDCAEAVIGNLGEG
jgi:ATP-binding cassette subfamily G (WHITE) protein 2 (PDR)